MLLHSGRHLARKHRTSVEVTDSINKLTIFLHSGIYYARKEFIEHAAIKNGKTQRILLRQLFDHCSMHCQLDN
jgi:hypothetical protein